LQSTSVKGLVAETIKNKMPAVAISDIGNMMGAFHFVRDFNSQQIGRSQKMLAIESVKHQQKFQLKPIVGCEFYVCEKSCG
jgi:DNA polymerase-3 subunit alpha